MQCKQLSNSSTDRDISLPGKSSKVFLYHWGIHLQHTGPLYPADFSMKQGISKTVPPILAVSQSLSSIPCRMSGRLVHEAGTSKDCLTFRQVWQLFLWVLNVQYKQHILKKSRQVQFLAQMASFVIFKANSTTSFFHTSLK